MIVAPGADGAFCAKRVLHEAEAPVGSPSKQDRPSIGQNAPSAPGAT